MSILLPQRPPQENLLQHTFDLYGDDIVDGVVPSSVGDKSRLPSTGRGYNITDPTSLLRFTDLTGITITVFEGTTTPTINGNDIEFTTGILYSLTLSNGAFFNCEDTGLTAFNSAFVGFNATKVNTDVLGINTFSYESNDVPKSYQNEVGYSDGDGSNNNGLYIPRNESNPKLDVLGNPLQYKGQVSYPAKLVKSDGGIDLLNQYVNLGILSVDSSNSIYTDGFEDYIIRVDFEPNVDSSFRYIFATGLEGTDGKGIFFRKNTNNTWLLQTTYDDGTGQQKLLNYTFNYIISTRVVLELKWSSTQKDFTIFIDGVDKSLNLINKSITNSALTTYLTLAITKPRTAVSALYAGKLYRFTVYNQDNSKAVDFAFAEGGGNTIYPTHDSSIHANISTILNYTSSVRLKQDVYNENFENGYSLYQHNTDTVANPDIRVPLGVNPVITDYTKIKDVRPSQRNHNGAETKVDFNPYGAPELSELSVRSVDDNILPPTLLKGLNENFLFYKKIKNYYQTINFLKNKIDNNYQAVLDYAESQNIGLPTDAQIKIDNEMLINYKAAGLWDLDDVFYKFKGDYADNRFRLIDWKRLLFTGSTSAIGFTDLGVSTTGGSGSSKINTQWIPLTDSVNYSQNNASVFIKSNDNGLLVDSSVSTALGVIDGTSLIRIANARSNSEVLEINHAAKAYDFNPLFEHLMLNRDNANSVRIYHNSFANNFQEFNDAAVQSLPLPSIELCILGTNEDGQLDRSYRYRLEYAVLGANKKDKFNEMQNILI